jgi:hypothetical protein
MMATSRVPKDMAPSTPAALLLSSLPMVCQVALSFSPGAGYIRTHVGILGNLQNLPLFVHITTTTASKAWRFEPSTKVHNNTTPHQPTTGLLKTRIVGTLLSTHYLYNTIRVTPPSHMPVDLACSDNPALLQHNLCVFALLIILALPDCPRLSLC